MSDNKEKNLQEVKELLKHFKEIWDEEAIYQIYINSSKLTDIAHQIESMKLSDKFLLNDLSDEEKELINDKVLVIAHACR